MSSSQLLLQLLELSSGISSLSNLQLLSLQNSNSLFAFSPQLLSFVSSCGNSLNELSQIVDSPVNSLLLNLNGGNSNNACLEELLQLEQLFLSGNSNINLNSNSNSGLSNLSNSTAVSASSSNGTAAVSSNATATADVANVTATATPAAVPAAKGKGEAKGKKQGRSEIVQRSAGEKRRVIGGLGFVAFMLVGAFAL